MLHFCPQCNQHYDCEPRFQEIFYCSLPLPHPPCSAGLRLGVALPRMCQENGAKLTGEKIDRPDSVRVQTSSCSMTLVPCMVPRGGDHCDFCCTPPVFKV